MRGERVSKHDLAELRASLSERDEKILSSLNLYRLMSPTHVVRLHFRGHASIETAFRACRRCLRRLSRLGLAYRLERRMGGIRAGSAGFVYSLSPIGARLLGIKTRRRATEPSGAFTKHRLAITEMGTLVTERCIEQNYDFEVQPEPRAWRPWSDGYRPQILKPDIAISIADEFVEVSWFVEIDLATESMPVIRAKCVAYMNYWHSGAGRDELFPRVLWVAPDESRAEQIGRLLSRESASLDPALFAVTTSSLALDVITDLRDDGT